MEIYRKTYLIAFIGMILLTVPAAPAFAAVNVTRSTAATACSEDNKLLCAQADDYAKAFAAGDYKAIANMWAPDGTFTDINGRVLRGRAAIEAYFKTNFERFGGQSLKIAIESIRFPSSNIAIEEGHSRVLQGPSMDVISHYSVVHLKENNQWHMYAVTETTYPEALNGSLQDLEWLIGNWYASPSSGKSINLKVAWATGHKFIRCLYETESPGVGKELAILIIGRNPSNGQIISWHFDSSGGYGSGKWIKDDHTWIERASSVEPNGATGSAIYVMRKLDKDTFMWRSTQRYLGNLQLPDGNEIKISRQQTSGK
jgi:uncharacterized protein (TIGR02246 family)